MEELDDAPLSLASHAIDRLDLPDDIKATLRALQAEISLAYQRSHIEMVQTMKLQASAIQRMQATLEMLVSKLDPDASLKIPTPIRIVEDRNDADLSTPLVLADPMAAGYVMTQADLARTLRLSQPTVSVLVRAFRLRDESGCAVIVRRGNNAATETTNYHPRAVEKFMQYVNDPPGWELKTEEKSALRKARRDLGLEPLPNY